MKNAIILLIVITGTLSSGYNSLDIQEDKYELKIEGMGCAFCTIAIQKKFRSIDGIDNEYIDLETGIFTFTLPVEKPQSKESIDELIDETGYELTYFKVMRSDGSVEEFDFKSE